MRKLEMEKKKLPDHARGPMENDFRECRKVFMDLKSDLNNQKLGLQGKRQGGSQDTGRDQYLRMQEAQERTNGRLKSIQQTANDTEAVGASALGLLVGQRETLEHTANTLHNSERYVDNSTGTLRGMARRYVCRLSYLALWLTRLAGPRQTRSSLLPLSLCWCCSSSLSLSASSVEASAQGVWSFGSSFCIVLVDVVIMPNLCALFVIVSKLPETFQHVNDCPESGRLNTVPFATSCRTAHCKQGRL